MKVLHATKVRGIGGAERHLLALLPALRERGIDARFLSLDAGVDADRFHRALEAHHVPYTRIACGVDLSPRLARDVTRAVRAEAPDLLHTHMVHADVYGSIAAHATRTPFVSTRHNDDRYLLGPFRHVDRALMHGVRRIIAISDAVRSFLERAGLPRDRMTTIHYGLDELPRAWGRNDPAPVADDARVLLAVCRLEPQKGVDVAIRALPEVRARHPDAELVVLGEGPDRPTLARLADDLGVPVHLLGRVPDVAAWLRRAELLVHPARWEGFGLVLLEAMLARLPVVAAAVSSIPEIVVDGETGILVPPDDPVALAEALVALLDDPGDYGFAGRRRARGEFSVARMADRTLEVYRAVVSAA